jgi:4-hydroxysphinganine ceramide fatty acyl 2-hydroxylase
MPARTLPNITPADVRAHNTAKSCYVTIGAKVYDVTSFLEDHPGGGDLILEYGGQDVQKILKDEISHTHSEAAYEILDECLIGFMPTEPVIDGATKSDRPAEIVPLPPSESGKRDLEQLDKNGKPVYAATGMSSEEDLSRETDVVADYKTHKFLDLSRPLFPQVWYGGFSKEFYLEQVHRPRHYKGGESAPLFGNFLEPLSKTPWWVVPTIWLPPVAYGTGLGVMSLGVLAVPYWCLGLFLWTLVEYLLHRFLFHLDEYVLLFLSGPECANFLTDTCPTIA